MQNDKNPIIRIGRNYKKINFVYLPPKAVCFGVFLGMFRPDFQPFYF
jgi:hypothetical protein